MHSELNLFFILGVALITVASPGPSTLAISAASMSQSRKHGLALASGISTGSLVWNVSAALGLGAIMAANDVVFEVFRYVGAGYWLYLAYNSLRSALKPKHVAQTEVKKASLTTTYFIGLALPLVNPKAILFFTALYAIGVPADANSWDLSIVVIAMALQTALIMHIYAVIFSIPKVVESYKRLSRWFDGVFTAVFGFAALKILIS